MGKRDATVDEVIATAREGRTDPQALIFLAEAILALKAAASPGFLRAKQGDPAYLNLDSKGPVE